VVPVEECVNFQRHSCLHAVRCWPLGLHSDFFKIQLYHIGARSSWMHVPSSAKYSMIPALLDPPVDHTWRWFILTACRSFTLKPQQHLSFDRGCNGRQSSKFLIYHSALIHRELITTKGLTDVELTSTSFRGNRIEAKAHTSCFTRTKETPTPPGAHSDKPTYQFLRQLGRKNITCLCISTMIVFLKLWCAACRQPLNSLVNPPSLKTER
jgi:hypothetical protein